MPAFRYEAVDAQGKLRRGLIDAETARQVRDQLRAEGLFPTAIDAGGRRRRGDGRRLRRRDRPRCGCPRQQVALSTRQLATLVRSGHAARPGARRRRRAGRRCRARPALYGGTDAQVSGGETLAGALARWPRTFSDLYRGLVAVAAETGSLPDVLARLADYLEARQAQKQKFTLALVYPALVTVIAIAVIAVLLVYVVPQIVSVYQQSRQTLPWLTQALIAVSGFLRGTGWIWLAGVRGGGGRVRRSRTGARRFARAGSARCCARRSWAGSSSPSTPRASRARSRSSPRSGAPLLRSLDAARDVVWALPIRAAAGAAALLVREGVSLARALKEQRVFPPVLIHLTANGEASGQLAPMLERAARRARARGRAADHWFAALLQPALIVAMGAIVLVLVLAVMLPIVSMNQLIR